MAHVHEVKVYYEDTDHTGVVYHANYLKFFERARSELLGVEETRRLYDEDGLGFVVYKADVTFRMPATFADSLEVHSRTEVSSPYRLLVHQHIVRKGEKRKLVEGVIHLACVNREMKLVPLPEQFA